MARAANKRADEAWGSLAERAYYSIREKILRAEYPLGAALSRRRLAAQFGMSFLPISEAIQRLEHDGLVESRPRVGTRVRIPTPQDLRDRYIIREALETQSARLFCEKGSPDERLELCAMAARLDSMMENCSGDTDPDTLFRVQTFHLSFHMRVAECTGSPALREAIEKNHVLIFNWLYDIAVEFRMPPRWHQDLMGAVAGKDPDAAAAAMRRHVRHGMDEIQSRISANFAVEGARLETGLSRRPRAVKNSTAAGWRVNGRQKVRSNRSYPEKS